MKIFFHPLFVVFVILAFFAGVGGFALALIIAVLVHEFSHIIAASHFGIRTKQLCLLPFGAQVEINAAFLVKRERIIILLAGSFGNMIFAVLLGSLLWLFPMFFVSLEILIIANAIPSILNLLPIYPLDGGKIFAMLSARSQRFIQIFSNLLFALCIVIGFIFLNLMLILFSVTMLFMINLDFKNSTFVSKFNHQKKIGKIHEIAITSDATLFDMYKSLSKTAYTKFIITDKQNKVIYENDLEQLLLENEKLIRLDQLL
ncbi:MAG: site-2 protease family protein [Firmicutes bacterium]|nr:site-2 protease family protein [Bacillota bacterium]